MPTVGLLLAAGADQRLLEQFLREEGLGVSSQDSCEPLHSSDDLSLVMIDEALLRRCAHELAALKARKHMIPVLLVASARSRMPAYALESGRVDDVMRMPISKVEMRARLRVLLRLSQQARAASQKFQNLFEDACWGVLVATPDDLEVQAANHALARMLKQEPGQLTGQPMSSLIAEPCQTEWKASQMQLLQRGSGVFETCFQKGDGTIIPVEVDASLYRDAHGQVSYVAAYVRDIQERKALDAELQRRHDELQQARRQAEQASQAKSDFLANVNHEIRTPLNGVTAALSLLAMTELSDEQQEYLRILKSSSENLLRLVNEILDFSKLERGKLQLEKSTVTVRPWLSEVVNAFRHSAEAKGLRLELEVESGVPETLRVDPVRLSHVLRNLISNSIKFTDAGEIRLSLQLSQPANLRFQITDSGIGVPPELQRKIFQLFDQADTSSTRSYEGIGLGLTVADGLVRLMGGQLALTSEPGQGSRFHFEIRLELPEDALADPIQGNGRALDVLVVEDNPVNRRIMELMLQKLGHRATLARDAEDAFAAWEHQGFDVVLMDLQMPGMNGLDATREFRRREQQQGRPRVPIIALTGRALKHDREQCLASGMDDYFTKPIQAPQLSAALARLAPPGA